MRGVMHAPDVPDRAHVSVACRVLPESNGTHRYGFELDRPLSGGMQGGVAAGRRRRAHDRLERFQTEARYAGRLAHPGIVQIFARRTAARKPDARDRHHRPFWIS
jgi:hypothetical protein